MSRNRGRRRYLPTTGWERRTLRLQLGERDGAACFYCRTPADPTTLTFDHWVPLAAGGTSTPTNLRLACYPCNQAKGNRLPWSLVWLLLSTLRFLGVESPHLAKEASTI